MSVAGRIFLHDTMTARPSVVPLVCIGIMCIGAVLMFLVSVFSCLILLSMRIIPRLHPILIPTCIIHSIVVCLNVLLPAKATDMITIVIMLIIAVNIVVILPVVVSFRV